MVIVGASITISSHAKVIAKVTITLHWLFILVSHIVLCSLCDTMFTYICGYSCSYDVGIVSYTVLWFEVVM